MFKFNHDRSKITEIHGGCECACGRMERHWAACPCATNCVCVIFSTHRCRRCTAAVYRSAFAEDVNEMGERVLAEEGGFRELRLQRLV